MLPLAFAYAALILIGLLILAAFVLAWRRFERDPKPTERARPPMPVAWPTSAPPSSSHGHLGRHQSRTGHQRPQ